MQFYHFTIEDVRKSQQLNVFMLCLHLSVIVTDVTVWLSSIFFIVVS